MNTNNAGNMAAGLSGFHQPVARRDQLISLSISPNPFMSSSVPMLTRHHYLSLNCHALTPTPRFSIFVRNGFPSILIGNIIKLACDGMYIE